MSRGWGLLLLALALPTAGCGHTHTTDAAGADSKEKSAQGGKDADGESDKGDKKDRPRVAAAPRNPKITPVATSAEGLLKPGADAKIREKLAAGGFLSGDGDAGGSTSDGLRRFQKKHDLPATGAPDGETMKKLGLDPEDVFKKAETP